MTDTDYTPEELEALPQTETIFNQPALEFDNHVWVQVGYTIEDHCPTGCVSQGIPIKSGTMLIKDKETGKYSIVDEVR